MQTHRTAREADAARHADIVAGWVADGTVTDAAAGWAEIARLGRTQPGYLAYLRGAAVAR